MVTAETYLSANNANAMFYSCEKRILRRKSVSPIEKFTCAAVSCATQKYNNVTKPYHPISAPLFAK